MKKFITVLIASILISYTVLAQSAGDFRSIGNGNWNDPTKWETYNGSRWDSTTAYPGQKSGNGIVTIMKETEIKITASIPYPVVGLSISTDNPTMLTKGVLTFNALTAVTLSVSGDVVIGGELRIDDQPAAKTHTLVIGRNLNVLDFYDDNCFCYVTSFQTINQDDQLGVTFNTTDPNSSISNPSSQYILFRDITFNGAGILVNTNIAIGGTATFINGVVRSGMKTFTNGSDILDVYDIGFFDGSTVSGGSNASYIEGSASKSGVEAFTFPMGHEGFYAPLTISGIVLPERFFVSYNRTGIWGPLAITDPELFSISNCESWRVIRDIYNPVNPSIDITVDWTAATRCGSSSYISNVADVVLTTGFSHGGTGTGTTTNGSVTWSGYNHLDSWSPLSLGNVGTDCRTPFGLNTTNITTNSATVNWSAVPGAVSYDVAYSNYTYTWINAATGTTSTSVNLQGLIPSVAYFSRVRANCSSASSSYRQIYFTTLQAPPPPPPPPPICNDVYETNNTSGQAKTISIGSTISAGISSANDVDWFKVTTPNNSNTNLDVRLSNLSADYDLYVYNKNLQLVGSSTNSGTSNEVVVYNSNARKATYYIKVITKSGAFNSSQCYTLLAQAFDTGGRTTSNTSAPVNEVIEDLNKQFLYPNPASEFVYLNFNSATEGLVNIQIVNSIGQLVKQHPVNTMKGQNQFKIQVADIRPGMYILRINKGDLNLTKKFVISR
jgi:hypothetical protein